MKPDPTLSVRWGANWSNGDKSCGRSRVGLERVSAETLTTVGLRRLANVMKSGKVCTLGCGPVPISLHHRCAQLGVQLISNNPITRAVAHADGLPRCII